MAILASGHIEQFDCVCDKCGYAWSAFGKEPPVRCASQKCRSPYWGRQNGKTREDLSGLDWTLNTKKNYCRGAICAGVVAGRIEKPVSCSQCGITPGSSKTSDGRTVTGIEGHHPDYNFPLQVVWVCQPCHVKIHYSKGDEPPTADQESTGSGSSGPAERPASPKPERRPIAAKAVKSVGKSIKLPGSKPKLCQHGFYVGGRCNRCPGGVGK